MGIFVVVVLVRVMNGGSFNVSSDSGVGFDEVVDWWRFW